MLQFQIFHDDFCFTNDIYLRKKKTIKKTSPCEYIYNANYLIKKHGGECD